MKQTKKTKITLLSWTANPLETIFAEWVQSRTTSEVPIPSELANEIAGNSYLGKEGDKTAEQTEQEVLEVFEKVIAMKMPLGETIDFVFLIEHCSIALREQLVRHRIGHKFGDRLGADIIPDLAGTSSFWSQTTRIIDMGTFATDGDYLTPQWLEENGDKEIEGFHKKEGVADYSRVPMTISEYYHEQMKWIQVAYKRLVKAGMPMEDARNILPVAMQHRLTWKCNLSSIMHVLSRRSCWLAQLGMWEPVITGIVEELSTKIHPTFRKLIDPPCCDEKGDFKSCVFKKENEEVINNGNYPPCSLWVNQDAVHPRAYSNILNEEHFVSEAQKPRYNKMKDKFAKLWRRDPVTGERVAIT